MKKKLLIIALVFLSTFTYLSVLTAKPLTVKATSATTYTYTYDNTGYLVQTQDAYLPGLTITDLGLKKPNDLYIDRNNVLYIADSNNKRVVRYNITSGRTLEPITHPSLTSPQGLFVTDDLELYIADKGAHAIFVFDVSKEEAPISYLKKYTKPTEVTFGEQPFSPIKVGVDKNKNMFVLSEGVLNGIIYLSNGGEFLEYYTSNRVNLSLLQLLQDMFFTEAQIEQLFPRSPHIFSNFFVADDGHVYTTTTGRTFYPLKKHNTSGKNLYSYTAGTEDLIDVWSDKNGLVYAASKAGYIIVYTNEGEFIYVFGARNIISDIAGVFDSLISIAVDNDGNVWALDTDKGIVQSFTQNDYAKNTYKALTLFNDGKYDESLLVWEEILRFNQMSVMAHNGIGRCHLYLQHYEQAMVHFEIAGNRWLYSEAYWEVRNTWLQSNLTNIFIILVALVVLNYAVKLLDKKYHFIPNIKSRISVVNKIKIIDDLLFAFRFFKKPIDSFYELKTNRRGSTLGATIIFVVFFFVFMLSIIGKDFIYQFQIIEQIDFNSIIIGFFSIATLFIVCNYLMSSILDGDGSLKDIFKLTMYSLTPYLIGLILVISFSYVLTYNESFILQYIEQGTMIWSLFLLMLGVQEIHTYDTRDAVKSIFFTLIFMILVAIILLIVIILCEQLYTFVEILIKEAFNNVLG